MWRLVCSAQQVLGPLKALDILPSLRKDGQTGARQGVAREQLMTLLGERLDLDHSNFLCSHFRLLGSACQVPHLRGA